MLQTCALNSTRPVHETGVSGLMYRGKLEHDKKYLDRPKHQYISSLRERIHKLMESDRFVNDTYLVHAVDLKMIFLNYLQISKPH